MGNGRKYQGETHYTVDHQGRRPRYRKPPLDNRHSYVPSWEKKFCSSVGSVSWRKLLEAKRYMHLHDNVVQWDDSACKEAFNNAKSLFWAEINGLSCNISLPDPNIYIDNVDWDSSVDPELLLDLEKARKAPTTEVPVVLSDTLPLNQSVACTGWGDAEADLSNGKCNDQAVILSDTLQLSQSFACTGWGDAEGYLSNGKYNDQAVNLGDTLQLNQSFVPTGWGDAEADLSNCKCNPPVVDSVNQWEEYCIQKNDVGKEYEWGNGWDGWNQWDDKLQKLEEGADGSWRTWQGYHKKKERLGYHVLHKNSNLPNDEYQRSGGWRNGRGRKTVNFGRRMLKPYLQRSR